MALSITDSEADRLVRELAAATGESVTEAARVAFATTSDDTRRTCDTARSARTASTVIGTPRRVGATTHAPYGLTGVRPTVHNGGVEVHRTSQFARWTNELLTKIKAGDPHATRIAQHVLDELDYISALDHEPDDDTATLKRVRQSGQHQLWRLSHPYDPAMAIRIICWFDDQSDTVVVALFANDKAPMGDVFYDTVGTRADQVIDQWKRQNGRDDS